MKPKLLLASASPRRRELFKNISEDFETAVADIDESVFDSLPGERRCIATAAAKAEVVFSARPECTVIGCDTVVSLGSKVFGKPVDRDDAARMLRELSGRVHTVYTGVRILSYGCDRTFSERTEVEFYPLSDADIAAYCDTGEPYDKAGAYGIQQRGSLLVHGVNGDYFNVMGLPTARLYRELRELGLL